mgnify:CR=1 FL=1
MSLFLEFFFLKSILLFVYFFDYKSSYSASRFSLFYPDCCSSLWNSNIPQFLYSLLRCIGVLLDFALVPLSFVAFLTAAVYLNLPVKFTIRYIYSPLYEYPEEYIDVNTYYTIPTYYRSFEVIMFVFFSALVFILFFILCILASCSYFKCLGLENPTVKIQASVAMMFFAMCVLALRLTLHWRNSKRRRAVPTGGRNSSTGSDEGTEEAFLAAPLPTSDVDEQEVRGDRDEYRSDGDEEVAVTFNKSALRVAENV